MILLNEERTKLKGRTFWISFLLVSVICVICMIYVDRSVVLYIDNDLPVRIYRFFEVITRIGEAHIWIGAFTGIALLCYAIKRVSNSPSIINIMNDIMTKSLFPLASILFAGISLNIIKTFIGRLRPRYFLADGSYGFQPFNLDTAMNSFPSGHSQAIWSIMTSLMILYPRYAIIFITVAVLVAASRFMIWAHFVSDVIMGSYFGFIISFIVYTWFVRRGYIENHRPNGSARG